MKIIKDVLDMENLDDLMLFPNKMKQKKLETAHYIELKKYSKKVYRKDIIANIIVSFLCFMFGIGIAKVLCHFF